MEKRLINLRTAENEDIDAVKVRSKKNPKWLLECATIIALVVTFDAIKAFNDMKLLKSYLSGGNRIINFCRQSKPTENATIETFDKHMI